MTQSKEVKIVASNLNVVKKALEVYQWEMQKYLNELPFVIPLKLYWIEHAVFGEIPNDPSGTLVFSNHSLGWS